MTITFFDLDSALPQKAWSPNTWKVRYVLNYKNLPYKTEWLEFPDVEAHAKKHNISLPAGGEGYHTLPALHDSATGVWLSDSFAITEYLEKTYPTPSVLPHGTAAFQSLFDNRVRETALANAWHFTLPAVYPHLNEAAKPYFRKTREAIFGKSLEDAVPTGEAGAAQWEAFKAGMGVVDSWYAKTEGPYFLGETLSWADIDVVSWLTWMRTIWGEDDQKWKDIVSWHDGRWGKLVEALKPYSQIV